MDAEVEKAVSALVDSHPGRQDLLTQLTALFTTTAPPSIHVHSPFSPRSTASLIRSVLDATRTPYATIHGAECLSQRLFFDRVLQSLAGWDVCWSEGCESYGAGKYSGNIDGFIGGLRAMAREKKDTVNNVEKMVLVIERAERFKENLPEMMVPLTRMADLSGLPFTTIFISEVSWFDLRPPYGAAIDPFIIQVFQLKSQDAISNLSSLFRTHLTPSNTITPYAPTLLPLYAHYASALYSICSPFLVDEHELAYIAAACWPNFVSPLLADWRLQAQSNTQPPDPATPVPADKIGAESSHDITMDTPHDSSSFPLPTEEARMRLIRYFTPSFTRALSTLYPRLQHASQWSKETAPSPDLRLSDLLAHGGQNLHGHEQTSQNRDRNHNHDPAAATITGSEKDGEIQAGLTSVAKYVLVAAFLASFNPAKSDSRLLGRAPDERGKKRRGGGPRKSRGGGRAKIPQRLVGPAAFPLDRLLAILGSLMEEHDQDVPTLGAAPDGDGDDYEMEKDTEMAVGQVQVSATISELVAMRLLHRTTPAERLDGPPAFKCGISQARAFELAREVGIGSLADFMWDTN